jgi:hypothetical protein
MLKAMMEVDGVQHQHDALRTVCVVLTVPSCDEGEEHDASGREAVKRVNATNKGGADRAVDAVLFGKEPRNIKLLLLADPRVDVNQADNDGLTPARRNM